MQIKDVAKYIPGYSNRLNEGDYGESLEVMDSSFSTSKKYKKGCFKLKKDTIEKVKINKNMIIFSPINTIKIVEKGEAHVGKLIGKNLVALEFEDKNKRDMFYYLLKYEQINFIYDGSIIKIARKEDILNMKLYFNFEVLDNLKKMDKYITILNDQSKKINSYIKGILQKGNCERNN